MRGPDTANAKLETRIERPSNAHGHKTQTVYQVIDTQHQPEQARSQSADIPRAGGGLLALRHEIRAYVVDDRCGIDERLALWPESCSPRRQRRQHRSPPMNTRVVGQHDPVNGASSRRTTTRIPVLSDDSCFRHWPRMLEPLYCTSVPERRHGKRRVSTPNRDAPLPLAARPENHAARE